MPDLNDKKIEILLHALEERYKSIHIIRERVQNLSLWILGLFITAAGWLLQSDANMTVRERWFFTIIVLLSIIFLRVFYFNDLQKGFRTQQRIQAKIEDTLGLCKDGVFTQEAIYPKEWSNAGTRISKGNFFSHNYLLVYLATAIFLACLWLK